jgi:SAM-dependent methyltransferase
MKPTPLTPEQRRLVYGPAAFSRLDSSPDDEFYARERLVHHLDEQARRTVSRLIDDLVIEARPLILDLMASWGSHLPARLQTAHVVGLGLNEQEMRKNPVLAEYVVHDLNADPRLPFADGSFDVVLNTVSVDYLTSPFAVFADVARALRPGGLFLVIFSNRLFPPKAVKIWREASEQERILIVEDYFQSVARFTESRVFISQGRPRPVDDRYSGPGLASDPVYAVYAETTGAPAGRRLRQPPPAHGNPPWNPEELARRKTETGRTLRCPYCGQRLKKWAVPQTPFTEYDVPFLYVCFNDRCPYFVRGWDAMNEQGNRGFSYRMMYHPGKGYVGMLPVPSPRALRESIVEEEEEQEEE